ncbi:MAG: hypothetical protein HY040_05550 [Planctomycetes bacterium]|nr:hypothetical protein [Planctomycetota bacterium]
MIAAFFNLAAVSHSRQRTFRTVVACHLAGVGFILLGTSLVAVWNPRLLLGNVLLVAGIVEGALLIGWRLTQMPKSQALEFLLVSPLRPPLVFLAETLVGLARLAFVTLSSMPVLVMLHLEGFLSGDDIVILQATAFTWGAITGLAMTVWAYESVRVRRWGERFFILTVILYLIVGVLIGEHLLHWLRLLPTELGQWILNAFRSFHEDNPFGVIRLTMEQGPQWVWPKFVRLEIFSGILFLLLLVRGAWRLRGHFQDEHYRPVSLKEQTKRPQVGDSPLAWWAVKRVTKYSGRINLWLAGGFALLYCAYIAMESNWPIWMGKQVFVIFDRMGGVPALATAMVLLAAVPAAFQYGLWDSNAQDRCRRLELLLLTRLDGLAYWDAAARAAWRRGRGYFAIALVLWASACWAQKMTLSQVLLSLAAGVILWGLYFAVGFRAFASGMQANALGMSLTLGLPLATAFLASGGWTFAAAMLPPGSVYFPGQANWEWPWIVGSLVAGGLTLVIARHSLVQCESQLRRWYDRNHVAGGGQ